MTSQEYNERLSLWISKATQHMDSKEIREEAKEKFISINGEEPEK